MRILLYEHVKSIIATVAKNKIKVFVTYYDRSEIVLNLEKKLYLINICIGHFVSHEKIRDFI